MNSASLQIENIKPGRLRLLLTDVSGRMVREEKTFGTSFEFQREDLRSGVYFFQISMNGERLGTGKLMVK